MSTHKSLVFSYYVAPRDLQSSSRANISFFMYIICANKLNLQNWYYLPCNLG